MAIMNQRKLHLGRKLQTFLSSVYIDLLLLGFFIFLSHLFYFDIFFLKQVTV